MNSTAIINSRIEKDLSMRERASRVIPGGMWGHMSVSRLPEGYPQFFSRAEGARLWDLDGNEYVDFICGYGPNLLGYKNSYVEAMVKLQLKKMDVGNGPTELLVDLAENLVSTLHAADWAMFSKNGTDATTCCLTIARAAAKKRKIILAKGAYHGSAPWCTPSTNGVTPEDTANLIYFDYNDIKSLERAVVLAEDDLAGIMISAFRHDTRRDQELPTKKFLQKARQFCNEQGAALILDDVRAGFRLNKAGSWTEFGIKPDLSAYSKALGNGYPIAAVVGLESFKKAATEIFVTGSFWCNASAMAAALATLKKINEIDIVSYISRLGDKLHKGIAEQAQHYGIRIRQTGPVQMPLILFDNDENFNKGNLFAVSALSKGVYLHPWHNMFLSLAHTERDIDIALNATDFAFQQVYKS